MPAALVVVLGLSGCRSSPSSSASEQALPPAPPVVVVTAREYRFDYVPPTATGRVLFEVRNAGTLEHQLRLYPLEEDFPSIDEQLHGTERRILTRFAGTQPLAPGTQETFAVDLAPGRRYALICFVQDADGQRHALKGMNAEFRSAAAPPPPGTGQGGR